MRGLGNTEPTRFVVRPRPYPDESHDGYLIRVAEANSYPTANYITGITERSVNSGRLCQKITSASKTRRDELARQLGLPNGEINRLWPMLIAVPPPEETIQMAGIQLTRADLRLGATHICPECVKEDGYCRQLWEIRFYTVCHRHCRLMLTHCPACWKLLSVHRGKLLECNRCGTDLGKHASKHRQIKEINLMLSYVIATALSGKKHRITGSGPINLLFKLDLASGFKTLRMMAWVSNHNMKSWLTLLHGEATHRHQELMDVLAMFEKWPTAWYRYLSKRTASTSGRKSGSFINLYPKEMRAFNQETCSVPLLRDAFWEWLSKKNAAFRNSEEFYRHIGRRVETAPFVSMQVACRKLGVAPLTIKKWAKNGAIQLINETVGAHKRNFVTRASIEQRLETLKYQMNFKEAAKELKISSEMICVFISRGLLVESLDQATGMRVIQRVDIEKLITSIESMRNIVIKENDINMNGALAMSIPFWGGVATVVRNIVDGRLPVTAFDRSRGIYSIRVSKVHLSKLMVLGKCGTEDEWIRLDTAMQILKMSRTSICRRIGREIRGKNLRPNKKNPLWYVRRDDCLSYLKEIRKKSQMHCKSQ